MEDAAQKDESDPARLAILRFVAARTAIQRLHDEAFRESHPDIIACREASRRREAASQKRWEQEYQERLKQRQAEPTFYQLEYVGSTTTAYILCPGDGSKHEFLKYNTTPSSHNYDSPFFCRETDPFSCTIPDQHEQEAIEAIQRAYPGARRLCSHAIEQELQRRWSDPNYFF